MITDSYLGGKGTSYPKIINRIAPHDVFISPFLGRDKMIQNMRKAKEVMGFDLDEQIVSEWQEVPWIDARHGDGLRFLQDFRPLPNKRYCICCDPPYPHDTRTSSHRYRFEFTKYDHRTFLIQAQRISTHNANCQILISTYPNEMYASALKDWHCEEYATMTRGGARIEHLYVNRLPEGKLHDYSYLGINRTQRQTIKRKADRWLTNLDQMPVVERNAILVRILHFYHPDVPAPDGQLGFKFVQE